MSSSRWPASTCSTSGSTSSSRRSRRCAPGTPAGGWRADVRYGEIRGSAEDLAAFEDEAPPTPVLPRRIDLEPGKVERGLTQLVMSLIELVRRLLEKQAMRRIE